MDNKQIIIIHKLSLGLGIYCIGNHENNTHTNMQLKLYT